MCAASFVPLKETGLRTYVWSPAFFSSYENRARVRLMAVFVPLGIEYDFVRRHVGLVLAFRVKNVLRGEHYVPSIALSSARKWIDLWWMAVLILQDRNCSTKWPCLRWTRLSNKSAFVNTLCELFAALLLTQFIHWMVNGHVFLSRSEPTWNTQHACSALSRRTKSYISWLNVDPALPSTARKHPKGKSMTASVPSRFKS